jgi:hypothetical protein
MITTSATSQKIPLPPTQKKIEKIAHHASVVHDSEGSGCGAIPSGTRFCSHEPTGLLVGVRSRTTKNRVNCSSNSSPPPPPPRSQNQTRRKKQPDSLASVQRVCDLSRHCSFILLVLLLLVAGRRRSYNTALAASCSNSTACK